MTAVISPAISAQIQSLCEAIAADPDIQAARQSAEAFLANEQAVALYRDVVTMGRNLEQQHRSGLEIEDEDINRFQALQTKADADDSIRAFNAAQETLQDVATHVNGFVAKTLEKGRVPSTDEVFAGKGGCGSGCGCH
ncbi:MAG TPA: YlbF family regulator [Prosthecobacter sp.]|nr:YlbF family regulator [Prosthecobacter sp.]